VIKSTAMFCPNCGQENAEPAIFCQHCGTPFQSKPTTSSDIVQPRSYAGFWVRFVALIIDVLIVAVASGLVSAATLGAGMVVSLFAPWLYEAFMLSSEWQATVGKRAMSIVVTGTDGSRISFARATGRHFAKYISAFALCIGFIMAAFTAKKQALHDMIAETLVVTK
jgi:uncharacterized RDD family membrane protein YckC